MRIIKGKIGSTPYLGEKLAVTFGNFDGVHIGHQALITATKANPDEKSVIFTFNPHPLCILRSTFEYSFLTPLNRKIEIIRLMNPDYLFIIEFDQDGASYPKDDFIKWLLALNVKTIVSGIDWRFGYKSEGTINDLKSFFNVKIINPIMVNDKIRVSSTYVKELLKMGKVKEATKLLGRYYFIEGIVSKGKGLGTTFGFATANIDIFGNVPPKKGVYAIKALVAGILYLGMCNVGCNPTIADTNPLTIEAHLFDFNANIYNEKITVYFLDFIRDERKFPSKDTLIEQLIIDKDFVKSNFLLKEGLK